MGYMEDEILKQLLAGNGEEDPTKILERQTIPEGTVTGPNPAIMPRPEANNPPPATPDSVTSNPNNVAVPEPTPPPPPQPNPPEYDSPAGPEAPEDVLKAPEWATSKMAGDFATKANAYVPEGVTIRGSRFHAPQQFGQELTPDTGDEKPRTPMNTYRELERINKEEPGGLALKSKKMTLGYGLGRKRPGQAKRQDAYEQYVQKSKSTHDTERTAQLARAQVNRANIADRDARTDNEMNRWNSITNGGTGTPVEGEGGSPYIQRSGGMAFLRNGGRFRPQSTDEAADSAYKRAQARYMESRPDIEADKVRGANAKLDELTRHNKAQEDIRNRSLAANNKMHSDLNDIRKEHNKILTAGNDLDRQKFAAPFEQKTAAHLSLLAKVIKAKMAAAEHNNYMGLPGIGGKDPEAVDRMYDPQTGQLGEKSRGDFDMVKNNFLEAAELISKVNPNFIPEGQVAEVLQSLRGAG